MSCYYRHTAIRSTVIFLTQGTRTERSRNSQRLLKNVIDDDRTTFEPPPPLPTGDIRTYHFRSDKIRKVLGFKPKYTIEDGVQSLVDAYKKALIIDGLNNPSYYNIKLMQKADLK